MGLVAQMYAGIYAGSQPLALIGRRSSAMSLVKSISLLSLLVCLPILAEDWPMYLRDLSHSSYNPSETAISPTTISALRQSWASKSGGPIASGITVSDGVLYAGTWKGDFIAVNSADGTEIWRAFAGMASDPHDDACQRPIGITSQSAISGNTVYVGGGDSAIYAFDKKTGAQLWRIPAANPDLGSYIWASMVVAGRALYVGVSSLGDCPLVRGSLLRIDLDTLNLTQRFLYPADGLGGGVWSTPAVDAAANRIYITTGTGEQNVDGGEWGGSMMTLDATTLEILKWFFLPTNSLDLDIEWGSSPTLFTAATGERFVAATGKDGVLYVNRADDLTPVWSKKLAVECISPEEGCGSLSTPAFDGKTLYVGAGVADPEGYDNGSVYALNPASGEQVWMRPLDGVVIAPVTLVNGVVFVPTTVGLYALDGATGMTIWDDGHHSLCYGQATVVDGAVYAGYINGDVIRYALPPRVDSGQPADSVKNVSNVRPPTHWRTAISRQ